MRRKIVRFGRWMALGILAFGGVPSPSTARADDKWLQIGSGIFSPDAEIDGFKHHHQSGRIAQVAWAWDNVQGHNVLWAGASHGGLWKSIIDGSGNLQSWVTITDNFPGSHVLGSFAIRKGDSNDIVIGTGAPGWGNGDGIYYSIDAGKNWNPSTECSSFASCGPARPERVNRLVADRSDSTGATLVAATSDGIWQSYDFGQTWFSRLAGVEATDLVQDTGDPGRWYAGVAKVGIYRSTTYATSWAVYGTGIKGSIARISLAVCDSDPKHLYALVVKSEPNKGKLDGVYRSADEGFKWAKIYSDNTEVNPNNQGSHASAIACDPGDPAHVFFGITKPVESTNAAATDPKDVNWTPKFDGGHDDYNFLLFSEDRTHLHIANDGGYYFYDVVDHTVNGSGNLLGINALELGVPQGGLASSWSNPHVFVAGLQDNGVVHGNISNDPAITLAAWGDGRHVSIMPEKADVFGFNHSESSVRNLSREGTVIPLDLNLAGENSAAVLIDPTPGITTPRVFTAAQDLSVPVLAFYTNNVYYNEVFAPAQSWTLVGPEPIRGPGVISHVDATLEPEIHEIVATVFGGTGVYAYIGKRDVLGALPLQDITPPLPSSPVPTNPDARINADRSRYQPGTLYYTSGKGTPRRAYVSRDGGSHWKDVAGDVVSVSDNADLLKLVGNPALETQYFLATSKGVFRSDDGGVHWKNYSHGLRFHEEVSEIVINFDRVSKPTLYIATHGRGFWRRTID